MLLEARPQATTLKAKLFRGFADPARLSILEALRDGPHTVGEIVAATGLRQSNVSNHLACLRDCSLVVATQQGRSVQYALADLRVVELLAISDALLADVAERIYACTRYDQPKDTSNEHNTRTPDT
jgi:DNA-binding transcriptional ArsR family regulator